MKSSLRGIRSMFVFACNVMCFGPEHMRAGPFALAPVLGGTNDGIYAMVQDIPSLGGLTSKKHLLKIAINFSPPNANNIVSDRSVTIVNVDQNGYVIPANTNTAVIPPVDTMKVCKFFRAQNLFCGPMELTDAAGHQIPMDNPAVNDLSAYPASFKLSETAHSYLTPNRHGGYEGALLGAQSRFRDFYLSDYYKIKQPGQYQLTVWPKIYKRSATNNDLCERIDLPPVVVPINWE